MSSPFLPDRLVTYLNRSRQDSAGGDKAFEEKLEVQRVGKKRFLGFVLHPWMDSGFIKLGAWFWAPSLI
jgi:hypothetical protein